MEHEWGKVHDSLMLLTTKELRAIGRNWFNGHLGGASTKAQIVGEMVGEMRNWWHNCAEWGGRERVANVMRDIQEVRDGNH